MNQEASKLKSNLALPIGSMYGVFTYIWLIFMVFHGGKYSMFHGNPMGFHSFSNYVTLSQNVPDTSPIPSQSKFKIHKPKN